MDKVFHVRVFGLSLGGVSGYVEVSWNLKAKGDSKMSYRIYMCNAHIDDLWMIRQVSLTNGIQQYYFLA